MWTRIGLALGLLLCGVAPALADGFVETSGTYAEGAQLRGFRFDVNGALKTTLATLLACEDQTSSLCRVSGGAVRQTTVTSSVTTNTTSTAVAVPTGSKTFYGQVVGTGAVTQTQTIHGSVDNAFDATLDPVLCTLTLSGTTSKGDACPVVTANFSYYFVVTTNTTGTSATGAVYAMY